MRLLIGGNKHKLFHLKELGDALTKLGVEYKLVNYVDVYRGVPSRKISDWILPPTKLNKLLDEFKPDIVLVDDQRQFGLAVIKKKIPLFVHLRGDLWAENKWARETLYKSPQDRFALWLSLRIANKCFKGASVILPICKYLEDVVKNRFSNKSTKVSYQGIDPSRWYTVDGMELKHPCVGLLQSANIWGKAKEMLILPKILEAMPDVMFYWVGDGPYRDAILEPLNKYNNFKWLGGLEYPDKVREYLSEIDVYALVSGIDMSPLTLLEAALMEKPVVATSVGGIPELMDNNKTGFLVEKGDYQGWIEKLSILINDAEKARQMGTAGRKFVIDNFSWDKIAREFVTIMKEHIVKS